MEWRARSEPSVVTPSAATLAPGPPLSRWGHTWRILVCVFLGLCFLLVTGESTDTTGRAWLPALYVVDLFVGTPVVVVLLAQHRRHPVPVALALSALAGFLTMASMAALLALLSVSTRRRVREIVPVAVVQLVAALVASRVYPPADSEPIWFLAIFSALLIGAVIAWGLFLGARRELVASWRFRAETAEAEQARRVADAREAERARIAREMHDVLAHRLSLVTMHAGALAYRTDLDAQEMRAGARLVQQTAGQALDELRGVLGVLRNPLAEDPTAPPQPTLADLPALIEEHQAAGERVELHESLDAPSGDRPSTTVGRHAYRIIQECLTNARKHAPGAWATVDLLGRPDQGLRIVVRNGPRQRPTGSAVASVASAGVGLVGLAERASVVGGRLTCAGTPDGGFRVEADLPWKEAGR